MPGAWPPGRIRPSYASGSTSAHASGVRELLVGLQLGVEGLRLRGRAELAEDHAVEQARIGRRRGAAALGGEAHLVAGVASAGATAPPPR